MKNPSEIDNLYDRLGVSHDATTFEINQAWKNLALLHHPDKGGKAKDFIALTEAKNILCDEAARRRYDATLKIRGRTSTPSFGPKNRTDFSKAYEFYFWQMWRKESARQEAQEKYRKEAHARRERATPLTKTIKSTLSFKLPLSMFLSGENAGDYILNSTYIYIAIDELIESAQFSQSYLALIRSQVKSNIFSSVKHTAETKLTDDVLDNADKIHKWLEENESLGGCDLFELFKKHGDTFLDELNKFPQHRAQLDRFILLINLVSLDFVRKECSEVCQSPETLLQGNYAFYYIRLRNIDRHLADGKFSESFYIDLYRFLQVYKHDQPIGDELSEYIQRILTAATRAMADGCHKSYIAKKTGLQIIETPMKEISDNTLKLIAKLLVQSSQTFVNNQIIFNTVAAIKRYPALLDNIKKDNGSGQYFIERLSHLLCLSKTQFELVGKNSYRIDAAIMGVDIAVIMDERFDDLCVKLIKEGLEPAWALMLPKQTKALLIERPEFINNIDLTFYDPIFLNTLEPHQITLMVVYHLPTAMALTVTSQLIDSHPKVINDYTMRLRAEALRENLASPSLVFQMPYWDVNVNNVLRLIKNTGAKEMITPDMKPKDIEALEQRLLFGQQETSNALVSGGIQSHRVPQGKKNYLPSEPTHFNNASLMIQLLRSEEGFAGLTEAEIAVLADNHLALFPAIAQNLQPSSVNKAPKPPTEEQQDRISIRNSSSDMFFKPENVVSSSSPLFLREQSKAFYRQIYSRIKALATQTPVGRAP